MANADWLRPAVDDRDTNPQTGRPENMATALARARNAEMERFAAGADVSGIFNARYVGPDGEDRHLVESLKDPGTTISIPSNGGVQGFAPGQGVLVGHGRAGWTIIGNPLSGEMSKQSSATVSQSGTVDLFGIDSASPNFLQPGDSAVDVTLSGFGFNESPVDVFTPVIWNSTTLQWDLDSDVTLGSVTWVSANEVSIPVTVASSASPNRFINLRMERG